jgi:hypothetical protein
MQEVKKARIPECGNYCLTRAAGQKYNAATPHRNLHAYPSYRYNAVIPHGFFSNETNLKTLTKTDLTRL